MHPIVEKQRELMQALIEQAHQGYQTWKSLLPSSPAYHPFEEEVEVRGKVAYRCYLCGRFVGHAGDDYCLNPHCLRVMEQCNILLELGAPLRETVLLFRPLVKPPREVKRLMRKPLLKKVTPEEFDRLFHKGLTSRASGGS